MPFFKDISTGGGGGTGTLPDLYNVMDFGAIGDGVTDDTVEVQAAITACCTAGGGVIFFPKGTYLVSNLTYNRSGIIFRGVGNRQSVLWMKAATSGAMITPVDTPTYGYTDVTFEYMQFIGYDNTTAGSGCYDALGTRLFKFYSCNFGYFQGYAVKIKCGPNGGTGTSDSIFNYIQACAFENNIGPAILSEDNGAAGGQGYTTVIGCQFNGGDGETSIGVKCAAGGHGLIIGNYFMGVAFPWDVAGAGWKFWGNHLEHTFGDMVISMHDPVSAPGQTFFNQQFGNLHATSGNPALMSVTDTSTSSFGNMRMHDGIQPHITAGFNMQRDITTVGAGGYILAEKDAGRIIYVTGAGTIQPPPDLWNPYLPLGSSSDIVAASSGVLVSGVTLGGGTSVVPNRIQSAGTTARTITQGGSARVTKVAANNWELTGDIT